MAVIIATPQDHTQQQPTMPALTSMPKVWNDQTPERREQDRVMRNLDTFLPIAFTD